MVSEATPLHGRDGRNRAMPLRITSDGGYSTAATARPRGAMRAVILDGEDGCRRGDPIAGVVRVHAECLGVNPNLTFGHPSSVGLLFSNAQAAFAADVVHPAQGLGRVRV